MARFRGSNFDNISPEPDQLVSDWGNNSQRYSVVIWVRGMRAGCGNGCVYILDYDENKEKRSLRCFLWPTVLKYGGGSYKVHYQTQPRNIEDRAGSDGSVVVTMGPMCHVMCVEARTGDYLWGMDLVRQFETKVPLWYTAQCLGGGQPGYFGSRWQGPYDRVDCESPHPVGDSKPDGWEMFALLDYAMSLTEKHVRVLRAWRCGGVSARARTRGRFSWKTEAWNLSVVAPSPVILPEGRIFLTAGYGGGSMMIQVTEESGRFQVRTLYKLEKTTFACDSTPPFFSKTVCLRFS